MRKRITLIIVILLWVAVLVAGFRYFSAKFKAQAIKSDNQRLYDISINDYHIAQYYIDHHKLPDNLAEVAASAKKDDPSIMPPVLDDPDTKQAYTYQTVGDDAYQICTTFSTDTLHDRNLADDYSEYLTLQLEKYTKSVYHKKGYDCLELTMEGVAPDPRLQHIAYKTTNLPEEFMFRAPLNGEKVCLGQDYNLSWQSDENTDQLGFYLIPPTSLNQPQSWLLNGYNVSPGQLVSDYQTFTQAMLGTFSWKVGTLEKYDGAVAQQPVPPGQGYEVGVDVTIAGVKHTYSSDPFEIVDCNVASATTPTPLANTGN